MHGAKGFGPSSRTNPHQRTIIGIGIKMKHANCQFHPEKHPANAEEEKQFYCEKTTTLLNMKSLKPFTVLQ